MLGEFWIVEAFLERVCALHANRPGHVWGCRLITPCMQGFAGRGLECWLVSAARVVGAEGGVSGGTLRDVAAAK